MDTGREWRTIFNAIGNPAVILDLEHKIISANKAVTKILGKSEEVLKGKKCYEIFHEYTSKQSPPGCPMEALIKSGNFEPMEREMEAFGGYYLVSCTPILDEKGQVEKIIHIATDITGRKREDEKFYKAFEFSPSPMGITEIETGRFIDVNSAFLDFINLKKEDIIGKTSLELNIYEASERNKMLWELKEKGFVKNISLNFTTSSGKNITGLVSGEKINLSGKEYLLSAVLDITAIKKAEEILRINEIRLETMLALYKMSSSDIKEITDFVLEKSLIITGSKIGYLAFLNDNQNLLTMYSWSKSAMEICNVENLKLEYNLSETGLWGEAVRQRKPIITNDYSAPNFYKKGYPEGHVLINRHMNIPVFQGDKIVLVAGVGNKETNYDENDVKQLNLLMTGMWDILCRKKVEENIRKNEERLKLALDSANDGLWDWNLVTGNAYFSPRYYTMLGYEPDEFPGNYENWKNLLHPDDFELAQKEIEKHINNKEQGYAVEFRMKNKNGDYRWILGRGQVVERNEKDIPVRMVGTHSDITDRKHFQEALLESESKYRELTELLPQTVYECDLTGRLTFSNKKGFEKFGYTEEDFENGIYIIETIVKEDRERALANLRSLISGRPTIGDEYTAITKDGRTIPIIIYSSPVIKNGKVSGVRGVIIDITGRKNMENELKESEKKFRNLFETMAQGVVYQDHEGKVISANPAAERILGLTIEQMTGRTSLDSRWKSIHEDGSPFHGEEHPAMVSLRTGLPVKDVVMGVFNPSLNEYRWIIINSIPQFRDGEIRPYQAYATITDITEIKTAEEKLMEKEKQFHSLFENMAEGVALHEVLYNDKGEGLNYKIIDINRQYGEILDLKREQVIGKWATDLYGTSDPPYLKEFIDVSITGKSYSFETYFPPMEKYFQISVAPWIKGGFATIFFDITARKKAEKERENILKELERKNKELESIVYVASHDLRSPLINIQGFSQRLEKSVKELKINLKNIEIPSEVSREIFPLIDERIPSALKFIQISGNKMDGLINGLLKLSRAGRVSLHLREIDMNDLMDSVIYSMAFQIESAGAIVKVGRLPSCYGDVNQINQVFSNLLDNAIKYKNIERKPVIKITGHVEKGIAVYTVSDNGIGISSDYNEKIWDLFYRLNYDKTIAGDGIGLTLSRRIIERHNGKIWCEAEDGKGSRFFVELPVKP